jgi:hypothetical protein
VFRLFDTSETVAIDDTIDSLENAGIDYVIVDLTNNIGIGFILTRTQVREITTF